MGGDEGFKNRILIVSRLCETSWIDTYLRYTSNQESPKAFHYWVAISTISAVLQRKVWIPRVKYVTYPNLYIILIAGSAKCRKSIAIRIGMDLLKSIKNPPTIFAQKITTEALIQALEESKDKNNVCYGIIVASELSVFLGSDSIRSGIIPALTDLYDSPAKWQYHTRSRGREELTNVTLSMLAASTKDWLRTSIPESAVGGGFTSRLMFIVEDNPSKLVLFPQEEPEESDLKFSLISDLERIGSLKGSVKFSEGAKNMSLDWYEKEAFNIRDEKVDGYYGRKHDTMFKLATIISVSENDSLWIEEKHIEKALNIMEVNEKNLSIILESVTSSQEGGITEKILNIIKKFGKVKYSDLLQKCWRFANASELSEMLKTLVEGGEVKMVIDEDGSRWFKVER